MLLAGEIFSLHFSIWWVSLACSQDADLSTLGHFADVSMAATALEEKKVAKAPEVQEVEAENRSAHVMCCDSDWEFQTEG